MSGKTMSLGEVAGGYVERARQREEEHERRMREDPEYRAEQERRAAEERKYQEAEARRREKEHREQLAEFRWRKRIPTKFLEHLDLWRADSPLLPPTLAKARRWVRAFASRRNAWTILALAGPPGVGKTTAACGFLDAPIAVSRRRPVPVAGTVERWEIETSLQEAAGLFVTAPELARASAYDGEFWDELREAPRLVVDDLGSEQLDSKGWALANLTNLLVERHAAGALTLLTTNLPKKAFEARFMAHDGGRLLDRFTESGWWLNLTGPSLRRPLALEEIDS